MEAYRLITGADEGSGSHLSHYGVLGMKWGVRRTQEQLGRHTIKKGTVIRRTTTNPDEKTTGHAYVSYLEPDSDRYRGWNTGVRAGKTLYEKTYTAKQDITVPGRKELTAVVYDIVKKDIDNKFLKEVAETKFNWLLYDEWFFAEDWEAYFDGNVADRIMKEAGDDWHKQDELVKKYAKEQLTPYVNKFIDAMSTESPNALMTDVVTYLAGADETRKAIVSELKRRGYNAMVDEGDVGGENQGKRRAGVDPLIIFDQEESLTPIETRPLSNDEQTEAAERHEAFMIEAQRHSRNKKW